MRLRLALPKGRLQPQTAALLSAAGLTLTDYAESTRAYRLTSSRFPELFVKVFHEKDVVIQTAIGNYDLGICGRDWVDELLNRFPNSPLVKLSDLGFGRRHLYAAVSCQEDTSSLNELRERRNGGSVRIVSEYPNLAEAFALRLRIPRFRIFPVWGAAEAYPPENAELAVVTASSEAELSARGLAPIDCILSGGAQLMVNRTRLQRHNLSEFLLLLAEATAEAALTHSSPVDEDNHLLGAQGEPWGQTSEEGILRLALPDGHQQKPTVTLLRRAGLEFDGYTQGSPTRRPRAEAEGVVAKVIRPQDMPLQVANGNFDLAITGLDWLRDHHVRFPSSPVTELADLGFGKVRIVAAVSNDLPIDSPAELREWLIRGERPFIRVASEYVNLADKYARDHHLAPYRVTPTWGATEAFLPEDADLLIENTETGTTLARHNLKIIDTLFVSSARLIGRMVPADNAVLEQRRATIVEALRGASEGR